MSMKKRRLFIAINLPEQVKDKIGEEIEKIRYGFTNDIRFLSRDNWHITLVFLGYQNYEDVPAIIESIEESVQKFKFSAPTISLESLTYGPIKKIPRMIWINGSKETSQELTKIRDSLRNQLLDNQIRFKMDYPIFHTHLTLARFYPTKELLDINRSLNIQFQTQSLDLMESHLSRKGANYEPISKIAFQRVVR